VLGGDGAFPSPGGACSGYLVEHAGFHLLVDPGYATFPRLVQHLSAERVDAVVVTHGHPDHCADLNPLLRSRALRETPCPPLPVYSLPDSLGAVLALDRVGMLDTAILRHEFDPGDHLTVGPFHVATWSLPHSRPNAGIRLSVDEEVLAYTGDTGPSPNLLPLARSADLYLAEATYADEVEASMAPYLSSARQAGEVAEEARVRRLVLTHLWPGEDRDQVEHAARQAFSGTVAAVRAGMSVDLSHRVKGHQPF
jgi:ribonuclease BN (tRNA processing enzyme)